MMRGLAPNTGGTEITDHPALAHSSQSKIGEIESFLRMIFDDSHPNISGKMSWIGRD